MLYSVLINRASATGGSIEILQCGERRREEKEKERNALSEKIEKPVSAREKWRKNKLEVEESSVPLMAIDRKGRILFLGLLFRKLDNS